MFIKNIFIYAHVHFELRVQILPNLFGLTVSLCTQMLKDNLNMYKRNIIKNKTEGKKLINSTTMGKNYYISKTEKAFSLKG